MAGDDLEPDALVEGEGVADPVFDGRRATCRVG